MNKQAKIELLKGFYKSHGLNLSHEQVETLQTIASKAQALSLRNCNVGVEEARYERLVGNMQAKLDEIFAGQYVKILQVVGDPRGYTLKIAVRECEIYPQHYNE
jgi:hypothetical protein